MLLLSAQDGMLSRLILRGQAGPEERLRFGKLAFGARKARSRASHAPAARNLDWLAQRRHVWDASIPLQSFVQDWACTWGMKRLLAESKRFPTLPDQAASTPEEEYRAAAGEMLQESGLPELERRVLRFLCAHSGALKLAATLDDAQRLLLQVRLFSLVQVCSVPRCTELPGSAALTFIIVNAQAWVRLQSAHAFSVDAVNVWRCTRGQCCCFTSPI